IGAGSGGVLSAEIGTVTLDGKEYDLKGAEEQLRRAWKELEKKYEAEKKKDPDLAVSPSDAALPQPRPRLLWQKGKDQWHVDSAVAVADGRVLAASAFLEQEQVGERALFCLKEADGSTLWKVPLKHNPWGGPTVAGDVVLVGGSAIRL